VEARAGPGTAREPCVRNFRLRIAVLERYAAISRSAPWACGIVDARILSCTRMYTDDRVRDGMCFRQRVYLPLKHVIRKLYYQPAFAASSSFPSGC